MSRLVFILLSLMLSTSASALGRVVTYEEVGAQHFSSIQNIDTCGSWHISGKIGAFRVIQVYLYGQDMLFIDMVHPNSNGSELVLERGFTFAEINNDHSEIGLNNVKCSQISENRIEVTGEATSGHDNISYQFKVLVNGEAGQYVYQEFLSNK